MDLAQEAAFEPRVPTAKSEHYAHAAPEVDLGLVKYGSIERWPVLTLLPNQFPLCVCGQPRNKHRYSSTDLLGPKPSNKRTAVVCNAFRAQRFDQK